MVKDSVVIGGIYRTTDVTICDLTYEPGSIVKVLDVESIGATTELLFGAMHSNSVIAGVHGFVFFAELEEIE